MREKAVAHRNFSSQFSFQVYSGADQWPDMVVGWVNPWVGLGWVEIVSYRKVEGLKQ